MNKDKMIKWLDEKIYYTKLGLKNEWLVKGAVLTLTKREIVEETLKNIEMLEEIRKAIMKLPEESVPELEGQMNIRYMEAKIYKDE